jgi:hypothetical protein
MADLKNSQRNSYKATYNQMSPAIITADTPGNRPSKGKPTASLHRAVEKTAFMQSLRITPEEFAPLQRALRSQKPGASGSAELQRALDAIEHIINDHTATSTINNAALFAKIKPSTLVAITDALILYRESISEAVNSSIAEILSAYRESFTPQQPSPPAVAPTSQSGNERASTQASKTSTGIPIRTTTVPVVVARAAGDARNREVRGFTTQVSVDESAEVPVAFSSALNVSASAAVPQSNADAIAWAEKYKPELFATLSRQLAPYTGLSAKEIIAVGGSTSLVKLLTSTLGSTLDTKGLHGAVAGFQSRMAIEPVGNLHLERIEMYPAGVERGELVHSVALAPGEIVNISHKEWSVSEREFEEIVSDSFEGYSEQGVADKTDIAMSTDSQSQHATALNLGASLSASYGSVTLSTSFGYNATANDTQSKKDSRNHSMAITKNASARTKKDHKVSFKVTSIAGSEDQSVRVISNPSDTESMRIDYFQLARKWKVDLLRYGLRMTYDIVIPNPGSGIVTLVDDLKALDAKINTPFSFTLPLSAIYYHSNATDPLAISNYDQLAAQYQASVAAPPEARKWVNVHKESSPVDQYDDVHFDSVDFEIDDNYYIYAVQVESNYETNDDETNDYFKMLGGESVDAGLAKLIGLSGRLSVDFMYQHVYYYGINITFTCRPKVQTLLEWRLQVWNQIRQAAEDQYNWNIQNFKDQRAQLAQEIADFDALTLRRLEKEEIMKGVLRWLLGPQFSLVPFNISSLFGPDSNDPEVHDVLDPNQLSDAEWLDVMEHGEFIKYIHNAIEWENVLYFTYPYFWDDNKLWDFKKFLHHPDPTHRTFLRSGAARVVLTIRPGFETSFTSLIETGAFNALPAPHPYVTIAQEIRDFANTNYPGFPPANPEQDARPLLYLEQRRVWKEMQFIVQLLNACKDAAGAYPPSDSANTVPAAALTPYLDGPVIIDGVTYAGINDYNTRTNNQQLLLDPSTPQEALLPIYTSVPVDDVIWTNPYFYQCAGDTGDYDLISFGANGLQGGTDKDADISANSEASLISTWFEYTPVSALDIGITKNQPNVVPPQPSAEIA